MTGDANPFRGREKKKSLVDNWLGKKFVGDKKAFQDLYQEGDVATTVFTTLNISLRIRLAKKQT